MAKISKKKGNKIKKFFLIVFLILTLVLSVILLNGYNMCKEATTKVSIDDKIKEIRNNANFINIDKVSRYYLDATIAVEDHRFYKHFGVDPIATINALFDNILSGEFVGRGGSSITQQLAKNMYFSQEKKFSRKVAELFVAFQLEQKLTKQEILELYINIIYFGNGYYGIRQASLGYYDKTPLELTFDEALLIAGLPSAPSVYSPTVNEKLSKERKEQVRKAMIKHGYIEKSND
ncbi:MAG: glycosyl transferase [Firmicutes bacterium]|nr:glycosyl transferase [Bacillota bacterium]